MIPGDGRPWLPAALFLLLVPGYIFQIMNTPVSVVSTPGKTMTVRCPYERVFSRHAKYWCKSPCLWKIVETNVSGREVRNGRVSLLDNQAALTFRVTMRNLREEDAGTYRCGIDTSKVPGYIFDLTYPVVLSVTSGLPTIKPTSKLNTVTPEESPISNPHSGSLLGSNCFLLLVFLEVPLVLIMLSAVL